MDINEIQELNFRLMELASFNNFDGEKVVKSLKQHRDLWKGVIMDRASYQKPQAQDYSERIDLIKLRDIGDGYWNVDTLYILSSGKDNEKLELLARSWGADEVDWIANEMLGDMLGMGGAFIEKEKILRVWWD